MKLLNWNLEWRTRRAAGAPEIARALANRELDVVCLTETVREWLPAGGGVVEAEADFGYGVEAKRRKVALLARDGFVEATNASPEVMPPGRFVSAVTRNSGVRLVGVCIPWSHAHVSTGRRDRRPWEEHVAYLQALGAWLQTVRESHVVVVGDFNQTVPRSRAPHHVYDALLSSLGGLGVLTAGRVSESGRPLIDHVAASPGIELRSLEYLPVVSDHVGWVADLALG